VKASTLAQYADAAGAYTTKQSHSTPHRRKLPPRGSPDGVILAERIRQAAGTDKVRTLTAKSRAKQPAKG
jgi:hypothetical protein